MNTILWYQGEFGSQKGILVIDGKRCACDDVVQYNEAFDKLMQGRTWPESQPENIIGSLKSDKGTQTTIRFNSSAGEIFIQSHFVNCDEQGRKIAFMFYQKSFNSGEDVCNSLTETAIAAGMTVSEANLSRINLAATLHLKKNKYCIMATVGIAILILLIILCKK